MTYWETAAWVTQRAPRGVSVRAKVQVFPRRLSGLSRGMPSERSGAAAARKCVHGMDRTVDGESLELLLVVPGGARADAAGIDVSAGGVRARHVHQGHGGCAGPGRGRAGGLCGGDPENAAARLPRSAR